MLIKIIGIAILLFAFCIVSLWNLGLNDIWMKNEALYAESVREMIELKSYIVPYYNYEPRLHKPPITYWSILISTKVFGLNEFAVRFPMFLYGILTALFTYFLAKIFFDKKVAFLSVIAITFSSMFVSSVRYASPEMPLLFFFTATMYFFLKGFYTKNKNYYLLFYIFLGLTVLTKGYPYYFIIGSIIFLFLLVQSRFSFCLFLEHLLQMRIFTGIIIAVLIGCWWYVYVFFDQGMLLLKVLHKETVHRALSYKDIFLELRPTYYISVLLWAFLPYVLVAFLGIIYSFKKEKDKVLFFLVWIFGMYVIFTLSAGKIPNYFFQAFPALSIFAGYLLTKKINSRIFKIIFILSLVLPTVYVLYMLYLGFKGFDISMVYYLPMIIPIIFLIFTKKFIFVSLYTVILFYIFMVFYISPIIEKYRPYKEIGHLIQKHVPDKNIPIFIEDKSLNNLPFYAQRKIYGKMSVQEILNFRIPYVAIIYEKNKIKFKDYKTLWCGYIYKKRGDSRILKLLKYVIKAEKGDMSGFDRMCVIYKRGGSHERSNNTGRKTVLK